MNEHPENCPGCIDCYFDDSIEAQEQREIEAAEQEEERAEQEEAAWGLAPR